MIRVTINNTGNEPHDVVINPDRFLPSRQLIRQQIEAGKLGEVGLIRIHRWEHNDSGVGWDQLASSAGPPPDNVMN